jgi:aminoglycoside 6'-N-acetyltransferase I
VTSSPVAVRTATAADLPALVELTAAFYEEDGFTTDRAVLPERFTTLLGLSDARVAVATTADSDEATGFALTTVRLVLESGLVAEAQDLYVRPEHRGRGVGSALLDDAAAWARATSAVQLEVVVAPNGRDVSHLHRYYASRGFVDHGRRILHLEV